MIKYFQRNNWKGNVKGKGDKKLDILKTIKKNIITGKWWFSAHALKKCDEREIDIEKLVISLIEGEIIEDYPDDPRGHSCLILSYIKNQSVHTVCAIKDGSAIFITAYYPEPLNG
ncbi:hypothetical protein GCM10011409_25540 [Lentibacillus populi]|uniref:DUF4258 domain-containing protein n=1 Tax=Lentibacillus populi TaxID=1827502 RepID=A0A9W5TYE3_9BACI|nr:DUF4258 domain-containing protein [Lentibacillus populi]GGB46912.1 hypothetical protein GCM10011409_25540 [Lentibacillus populi]